MRKVLDEKYAIAVDLGGSHVRVALISSQGHILSKLKESTIKTGANGTVITRQISRLIHEVLATADQSVAKKIRGIGVASCGPLNYKKGGPEHSPNLGFPFVPLTGPLEKEFSLPVTLLNDCNAAVLGEQRFGAGKGIENLVYITISTGIGAGVIANNALLLGKSGNAAEVGHFIIDTNYDFPCSCGKGVGQWEGYASGRNIPQFFKHWARMHGKKINHELETAKDIFAAGRAHDRVAQEFFDELAKINARAISNIIAAYDPELITLGGSVVLHNSSVILGGIEKYVENYISVPPIMITKLKEDITLFGVTVTFFDKKNLRGA